MTNYLTQDAPLSPPDDSREEEEHFDRSLQQWIDDMPDEAYLDHCFNYCDRYYDAFTEYLAWVYRPLYDKLQKEIEDDRYPE